MFSIINHTKTKVSSAGQNSQLDPSCHIYICAISVVLLSLKFIYTWGSFKPYKVSDRCMCCRIVGNQDSLLT